MTAYYFWNKKTSQFLKLKESKDENNFLPQVPLANNYHLKRLFYEKITSFL